MRKKTYDMVLVTGQKLKENKMKKIAIYRLMEVLYM